MNYKNSKIIITIITLAMCFLINNSHVKADIKIIMGEKCALNSIYKDADSVEDALNNKMSQYLDTKFGTSQLVRIVDEVATSGRLIDITIGTKKYCPVYCVETDTFTWPGFKPVTQMGEHFTWTIGKNDQNNILSGLTVNLTGKRDCRNNIDLNEWQNDYNQLQNAIDLEEATLVRDPRYTTKCLPKIGPQGCGYKVISTNTSPYTSSTAEFVSNFNSTGAVVNGKVVENGSFTDSIHISKVVTVTTVKITSVDEVTGVVSWTRKEEILETLCPCEWKPAGFVDGTSGIANNGNIYYESKNASVFGLVGTICTGSEKEASSYIYQGYLVTYYKCTAPVVPIWGTETQYVSVCSSACSKLSGWERNACCKYNTMREERQVPVVIDHSRTVGNIEVEMCNPDWEDYNYDGYCRTYGPYCPDGYYLGKDAGGATKCYRRDTSILSYLLELQDTMQNILKDCTNISNSLELDTDMQVDFEEPTYDKTVDLERTKIVDKAETMEGFPQYGTGISRITGASCIITDPSGDCRKIVKYQKCSLNTVRKWCWEETADITSLWIAKYGKVFTVEYEYKLPSDFYKYVLIPSGKSVNKAQTSTNEFGVYQNFIDVGFPNYPVHYTTPTGTYNLDILYKNIGYQDHFTPYITTNIDTDTKVVTYDCEYDVENKKLVVEDGNEDEPEFGGIRLIYRPISLSNPFPSMLGSGRKTGLNWCSGKDDDVNCSNTNTNVEKYILDNRNTSGSEVYNKEPMYKVVLTPALIKEVRAYNNDTDYDDYNLYCEDGYKCQSEFIKKTFQGIFEGCGASNDFDYCDSSDGYQR